MIHRYGQMLLCLVAGVLAGADRVGRFQIDRGAVDWEVETPIQLGFGVLTGDRILLSTAGQLLVLDAHNGRRMAALRLELQGIPGGNLYCDGKRLLVLGLDTIHALGPARLAGKHKE